MKISAEGNYSVATLKEKFARAGRGKENTDATAQIIAKKLVVDADKPTEEEEEDEPLLVENTKRFVLFPIKYHEVPSYACSVDVDMANV